MPNLAVLREHIPAMSETAVEKVRALEAVRAKMPQVEIATRHLFHAGIYARSITIPAGVVLTGALIKIPTVLTVKGRALVYLGDETSEVEGYHVFAAGANRKQAFVALEDTELTMAFATEAKTVEEAEEQFTDEAGLLFSRKIGAENIIRMGE